MHIWVCGLTHIYVVAKFLPPLLSSLLPWKQGLSLHRELVILARLAAQWALRICLPPHPNARVKVCRQPYQVFIPVLGIRSQALTCICTWLLNTSHIFIPDCFLIFDVNNLSFRINPLFAMKGLEHPKLWIYRICSLGEWRVRKTHVIISQSQWRKNILKNISKWD